MQAKRKARENTCRAVGAPPRGPRDASKPNAASVRVAFQFGCSCKSLRGVRARDRGLPLHAGTRIGPGLAGATEATAKIAASPRSIEMAEAQMPPQTVAQAREDSMAGPRTGRRKTMLSKAMKSLSTMKTDTRTVRIGAYDPSHSPNNVVTTSKFTWWNFLALALMAEFRRMANLYFLCVAVLMLLAEETGWYNTPYPSIWTVGVLAFLISISVLNAGLTDLKRHRADACMNGTPVAVVSRPDATKLRHIRAGDVIVVRRGETAPVDFVVLAGAGEAATCYIDTAAIDGETSLKLRRAAPLTQAWQDPKGDADTSTAVRGATSLKASIDCDPPNEHVNAFTGSITPEHDGVKALGKEHVILRGSEVHSLWTVGVCVYAGFETKLAKNMREAPIKFSQLDRIANQAVIVILGFQFVLSFASAYGMASFEQKNGEDLWYTGLRVALSPSIKEKWADLEPRDRQDLGFGFLTFVIMYCFFVPMSLYVTFDLAKITQMKYIDWDEDMACTIDGETVHAKARSLSVTDLGQVKYIFSDKTGTLTRNEMKLRRVIVNKKCYALGESTSDVCRASYGEKQDPLACTALYDLAQTGDYNAQKMLESFMLNNTVIVEQPEDEGAVHYQAESPDEGALVQGGRMCGYTLSARTQKELVGAIGFESHKTTKYEILATNEFDNDRKRMSIVLRDLQTSKIVFFCKGADSSMLERATSASVDADFTKMIDAYAVTGLRTLVYSANEWSEAQYTEWNTKHYAPAAMSLQGREEKLQAAADIAEKQLNVIGATAIEDRLQEGVPETIATLAAADIRLWVLTGDKRETAIEIARSCRLITEDMPVDVLASDVAEQTLVADLCQLYAREVTQEQYTAKKGLAPFSLKLKRYAKQCFYGREAAQSPEELEACIEQELLDRLGPDVRLNLDPCRAGRSALVLDGGAVRVLFAAGPALEVILFRLLAQYKAVLACRVTPKQKAQFVKLVQTHIRPKPVTLAIGDGANDVNMIMQAQVGVGICGLEGRQAVNAADFAIGQFRFLLRLLLIHGRWAYRRSATLILFSFYKNAVMAYCLFFFSTSTGFSGTSVYQSHFTSAYNIYLAAQIFWLGMFDRDADEGWILSHPRCYDSGRLNLELSLKAVLSWQINALLHGIVIYYVGYAAMLKGRGGVYDSGSLGIFGTTLMIVIAVSMNFKAFVSTRTINTITGGCGDKGGLGPLGFMASHKVILFLNLTFFFGMSWYASTPSCAEDTTAADMMEYWGVTHQTMRQSHTWLVALLVFGTWLAVDWAALAVKWNFNATPVDALVERSHIARWTLDPSTKPWGFSKIAHVVPAEAQVLPSSRADAA